MGLRRLLAALLVPALLVSGASAEGIRFSLSAHIDPAQYDTQSKALATGLSKLMEMLEVSGSVAWSDSSFELDTRFVLNDQEDEALTLHLWGLDSHWGVASNWLGDTELMVNHLALMEFAVKTYRHLGLPLQWAALLASPYASTSAYAPLGEAFAELRGETSRMISAEEALACARRVATLAEEDRALYYWVEAIGQQSGCSEALRDLLRTLPDYVAATFPEGLTVELSETGEIWTAGEREIFRRSTENGTLTLSLDLPELLAFNLVFRHDDLLATGTMRLSSEWLNLEAVVTLPTSLPVRLPFSAQVDVEGALLGDTPLHLVFMGEPQGDLVVIRQLLPDHSQTMMTLTLRLTEWVDAPVPDYHPEDIAGVNALSLSSETLAAFMQDVRGPLAKGGFAWLVDLPVQTCQAMMDMLEDSGILGTLTDALMQ